MTDEKKGIKPNKSVIVNCLRVSSFMKFNYSWYTGTDAELLWLREYLWVFCIIITLNLSLPVQRFIIIKLIHILILIKLIILNKNNFLIIV